MSEVEVDGEVLEVRALPQRYEEAASLVLRGEVRTAAIAVAGGALAGAATVAAVRAVSAVGSKRSSKRLSRRRRRDNVLASRSFLVDVHLLGR
ncbi:MAG TPA: hypothetical protein VF176_06390 [Solirubrobacterales bacterium]